MWSFGQGHFGHFQLRERGYLLTIYKYYNIYIIVAVLTASVFDFDQMTMTKNDRVYKNYIFLPKIFVNRNERLLPLQCQIEIADRRSLRVKIARFKSRNCAH